MALPAALRACGDRQIVVLTAKRAIASTAATSRHAWLVVIQHSPEKEQKSE
jgi:hypothetical protein